MEGLNVYVEFGMQVLVKAYHALSAEAFVRELSQAIKKVLQKTEHVPNQDDVVIFFSSPQKIHRAKWMKIAFREKLDDHHIHRYHPVDEDLNFVIGVPEFDKNQMKLGGLFSVDIRGVEYLLREMNSRNVLWYVMAMVNMDKIDDFFELLCKYKYLPRLYNSWRSLFGRLKKEWKDQPTRLNLAKYIIDSLKRYIPDHPEVKIDVFKNKV